MKLESRRGNAATEYVLLASVIVVFLASVSNLAETYCITDLGGTLTECESVPQIISRALQASLEDITFLINLPF